MRFSYTVSHVPGKDLSTADALSRSPSQTATQADEHFANEVQIFVDSVVAGLPATEGRLQEIRENQKQDNICSQIMDFCEFGWPEKNNLSTPAKQYFPYKAELTVQNGLLLKGQRLVIPTSMQKCMLGKIHEGHQGIVKCRKRAQESIWWPGLSKQLQDLVEQCTQCIKYRENNAEPMIATEMPHRPWQKVATDLFELNNCHYLIVVDYFSRFFEVDKLNSTTSQNVIKHLKVHFSRYGIPDCDF